MATSPLKITVNPALPKNEVDIICMLLAGRLRDLWNGKLFCAQLAINDLLKETAGIDALGGLRGALNDLKGGLDAFKSLSGYDAILSKVNQTLSGIGNIFSLGGLCPSPVTPPKIPDVLGQLNQNLFGQAGNILNALAQASTPQMCFGGGPGGFGVNWSNMSGNLKNLKNAIDAFKNDPANLSKIIRAFEENIKSQTRRMNSELDRLRKNLTDPLGIGDRQNTARKIQRTNSLSADYKVKDKRGIEHSGVLSPMITADVNSVLNRTDKLSTTPITYRIEPILDYCGETVGYKKVSVTGDSNYIGWTPDPTYENLNVENPTTNPISTYIDHDFLFTDDTGTIKVQDKTGTYVDVIRLTRGKPYRIGFKLFNNSVKFYNQSSVWTSGVRYGSDPVYGIGADGAGQILIDEESPYKPDYKIGEVTWDVLIENPTTPNTLTWNGSNGQTGNIIIDGPTEIAEGDRSYDLSMAFMKGLLHYKKVIEEGVSFERINTTGRFTVKLNIRLNDGTTYNFDSATTPHTFANNITTPTSYVVYKNIDEVDTNNEPLPGNKIVKYITTLPDGKHLVEKLYFNDQSAIKFQQTTFYITENLSDENVGFRSLVTIKFNNEIVFMNDSKLPYNEDYSYYWSAPLGDDLTGIKDYNIYNNDQHKFELSGSDKLQLWLSDNRTTEQVATNEFMWLSQVKIDPADLSRSYVNTDPLLHYRRLYARGLDGAFIDYEVFYKDSEHPDTSLTAPTNSNLSVTENLEQIRNVETVSYSPLVMSGGVQPYKFKLVNISNTGSGTGLAFNENTGQLSGIPTIATSRINYKVEGTDLLGDETKHGQFSIEVVASSQKWVSMEEVKEKIAAAVAASEANIMNQVGSAINSALASYTPP